MTPSPAVRSAPERAAACTVPTPARVGLDVGGSKIHGVVLDREGSVVAERRCPTPPPAELAPACAELARQLLDGLGLEPGTGSLGVGVPGVVDPVTGTVADAVNLGLLDGSLPLAELLAADFGPRVGVDNDTNACVLGLAHLEPGTADVVLLSLGTGVAAGVLVDGVLRRGASGVAGEYGHLVVEPAGPRCGCGQHGCLETFVSGPSLRRRWPGAAATTVTQDLLTASDEGDVAARVALQDWADWVARAVLGIVLTLDPAQVVLAGGVVTASPRLPELVQERLTVLATTSPLVARLALPGRVRTIPTDQPVAAVGAALLARR